MAVLLALEGTATETELHLAHELLPILQSAVAGARGMHKAVKDTCCKVHGKPF